MSIEMISNNDYYRTQTSNGLLCGAFWGPYNLNGEGLIGNGFIVLDH